MQTPFEHVDCGSAQGPWQRPPQPFAAPQGLPWHDGTQATQVPFTQES